MLESLGMAQARFHHLISSPGNGWWEWLNRNSHSETRKEPNDSLFLKNWCCCIQKIMILNFIIGRYKWHLSRLCDKLWAFSRFSLQLLSCFAHPLTIRSLITWPVQTYLRIKPCLDYIEGRRWNWGQTTCNTTTQIIIEMTVALLDIEKLFQLLIHQNDHRPEWNVHEIIHEKTSIKWDYSFTFVYGFY